MDTYTQTAQIFKALCDEKRVKIVEMLQGGEKCACKLLEELNVTQPTLSHHMKVLCDSAIVVSRRQGKWTYYALSESGCERAIAVLKGLTSVKGNADGGGLE